MDSQGNLIIAAGGSIKKIDTAGNELFSRYLPGAGNPLIAVDSRDDIYVAGITSAPSQFPFTNKLTTSDEGAFVMKLRGRDGTIAYSTSWGNEVFPGGVTVDSSGQLLVVGTANFMGPRFPSTPGAYASPSSPLSTPMYLVRFSAAGDQILLSARYGGQSMVCFGSSCVAIRYTTGNQVMLDSQGNIWVAGTTNTTDVGVSPDGLKTTCGCGLFAGDGFLAKFSGDGSRLLYGTYIGTSEIFTALGGKDQITSAALDRAGHVWMVGSTDGPDLPVTANAAQKQLSSSTGDTDGFIAEYDPATNSLLYATYFGGDGVDSIDKILPQPDGTVVFAGHSTSTALPVVASGFARGSDFVASLDAGTYQVTTLTTFPSGSTGTGLASTASGFVTSGTSSVAAFLESGGDGAPSLYAVANTGGIAATGQVAPGELISLYGANIGPGSPVTADLSSGQAPTLVGGVQVLVDGTPAPMLYAQNDQVNAIVPFGVSGVSGVSTILISKMGVTSNAASLGVVAASPEAFKTSPQLWAAALNQDGTPNTDSNRAAPGSIVSVFATGFGALSPEPEDGRAITGTLPQLTLPVQVMYQGQLLEVLYAGPAPTLVAGVMQVNFRLPSSVSTKEPSFQFAVGGWPSGRFVVLVQ